MVINPVAGDEACLFSGVGDHANFQFLFLFRFRLQEQPLGPVLRGDRLELNLDVPGCDVSASVERVSDRMFLLAKSDSASGACPDVSRHWQRILCPDPARDKHDVKKLFVPPAVDEDVDGGVDDEGEVIEVDEVEDPFRKHNLAVDRQLDAFVHVDECPEI